MNNDKFAPPEINAKAALVNAENAYINVRRLSNELRKAWETFGHAFRTASDLNTDAVELTRWRTKRLPGLGDEHIEALAHIAEYSHDEDMFLRNVEGVLLADPRCFWDEYQRWLTGRHIPSDLRDAPVRRTISLDDETAKRIARLVVKARKPPPASETARDTLRAFAVKHGVTVGDLEAAALPHDPHRAPYFRRISVEARIAVEDIVEETVKSMVAEGCGYQEIKSRLDVALDGFEGIAQSTSK